ncbi:MAG: hypothetical protein AABW92_00465, partial [Nanoarchaeota archaeon]
NTYVNLFVGFPGETDEDINHTIKFLEKNKENITEIQNIGLCFVLHSTKLYQNGEKYRLKNFNSMYEWEDEIGTYLNDRMKRLEKLNKEVKKLGIKVSTLTKVIDV